MRVLVTGGLGFVGYAVTHVMADAGHQVTILARDVNDPPPLPDDVQLIGADLRDYDQVEKELGGRSFDGVCHLAGLARVRDSFERPLEYFHTNVGGTINLLRALDASTSRPVVVLASTGAVYGGNAAGAIAEDRPARPDTPYAASKRAAEQLVMFHARMGAIGACVLRSFSISGAYNGRSDRDASRVITKALLVATGRAPSMKINGDGTAMREFTHVRDVAHAFRLALEATAPGQELIYNVGTGRGVSVRDVIRAVRSTTGSSVEVEHGPARDEPQTLVADSSLINRDLGWSAVESALETIVRDAWAAINQDPFQMDPSS